MPPVDNTALLKFCKDYIGSSDKVGLLRSHDQPAHSNDLKALLQWAQDCKSYLKQGAVTKPTYFAKHALANATVTGTLQGMLLTVAIFLTALRIYKSKRRVAPVVPRARAPKQA